MKKPKLLLVFILLSVISLKSEVIKNPKPISIPKNYNTLELVTTVPTEFDDDNIIAQVRDIAVDRKGNIYVFDINQKKVFIINNKNQLTKSFGRIGEGPGEFSPMRSLYSEISMGLDGRLYVHYSLSRFSVFDLEGNHVIDKKITYPRNKLPVVNEKGSFYTTSTRGGIIDVYDSNFEFVETILDGNEYKKFLFYEPGKQTREHSIYPNAGNTVIQVSDNSKLFVYLIDSSILYILDTRNQKTIKKIGLYPKDRIEEMKKTWKKIPKRGGYISVTFTFFIDQDDPNYFYLGGTRTPKNNDTDSLYRFNMNGEIVNVLEYKTGKDNRVKFRQKINNRFYAIKNKEEIIILKEH